LPFYETLDIKRMEKNIATSQNKFGDICKVDKIKRRLNIKAANNEKQIKMDNV